MNTMRRWLGVLGAVLFGFLVSGQDTLQFLTFEEALHIMTEENPALLQARENIRQREFERKAQYGLYAPQLSVGAKAVAISEPLHLDLTPVRDALLPLYETMGTYGVFSDVPNPDPTTQPFLPVLPENISTQAVRNQLLEGADHIANANWDIMIQEQQFATVTADFIWPILAGGKIRGANKAAEVELAMSREGLRNQEGVLLTELVTRYYGLVLGYQIADVRRQMLNEMELHYTDAQKLYENGMIARVEMLHAAVSRNEAERELKQAERNMTIVEAGLAATLVLDSTERFLPVSKLFITEHLGELDTWKDRAVAQNPQLKQLEGKKSLVDIQAQVTKASFLPDIAMMGSYNLAEYQLSPYVPQWMVGVGVKWTLAQGMTRQQKVKASATMQQQVDYAQQKAHVDITALMTRLYEELQMLIEQEQELESTLELAQEYSASTAKAFNEGFATSTMVVEAYTRVAQVKALRLKVFYDYDVALSCFLQVAGKPEQFMVFSTSELSLTESITKE